MEESQLDPVLGTWRTDEKRYAGRYFELRADKQLVIGVGGGAVTTGQLTDLRAVRAAPSQIDYVIEYEGEDGVESVLRFELDPQAGHIQMANQPGMVWTRTEEGHP